MIAAVSEASVPKISVIVRKAYGAGLYAMCGPAFEPDACLALPTASIAVMGAQAAVNAVFYNRIQGVPEGPERDALVAELREEYRRDIDLGKLASELVIDAVLPFDALRRELSQRFALSEGRHTRGPGRKHLIPRCRSCVVHRAWLWWFFVSAAAFPLTARAQVDLPRAFVEAARGATDTSAAAERPLEPRRRARFAAGREARHVASVAARRDAPRRRVGRARARRRAAARAVFGPSRLSLRVVAGAAIAVAGSRRRLGSGFEGAGGLRSERCGRGRRHHRQRRRRRLSRPAPRRRSTRVRWFVIQPSHPGSPPRARSRAQLRQRQ